VILLLTRIDTEAAHDSSGNYKQKQCAENMKRIFSLLIVMTAANAGYGQVITRTGSTVSSINNPDNARTWSVGSSASTAGVLNPSFTETDYMVVKGFDFASLPVNIVVTGFTVSFNRSASGGALDSAVRIVLDGAIYFANNSNAAAAPTTWTASNNAATYTFNTAALSALNSADFKNADFGVAILARRNASNTSLSVDNVVSIALTYSTLAPLILTDFSVNKNESNQVDIRFSTATEDNVAYIYVERSTDGKSFEKLFTITPRGVRNVYGHYSLTDKSPVKGNNYYRVTEVDKNGRWFFYMTKMVNISVKANVFSAYYDGSKINVGISTASGQYEVMLADKSGRIIGSKMINMYGNSAQTILDVPNRSSIYVVVLKGNGIHEAKQIMIMK
jgi:hypothetical protein